MDLNFLSPYIRVAWDSIIDDPFHIHTRVIFDYEILYVKEGELEVTINDTVYYGIPGDIFIFKPKEHHSIKLISNSRLHQPHIHFDFFYQEDSPEVKVSYKPLHMMSDEENKWFRTNIIPDMPNHIRLHNPGIIEKLIFDIINEMERKLPYYEISAKGLFIQLWTELLREYHWMQNKHLVSNFKQLELVKAYISRNTDREVTLDELAEIANLNKFYLGRLFKKTYGVTPIQFHLAMRLEKAKQLLQFTTFPITIISEKLGFSSIHAFSRAFRKFEGVSPSYYRKKS